MFNMLRFPLIMVPFLLTTLLNALNAVDRLGAFLLQDESDDLERDASEPGRVVVTNGRFAWPKVPKKTEAPKFPPGPQGRKMKKAWEAEQKAKKTAEDEARADAEAKGEEFIVDTDEPEQPPFELGGVDLDLKPGSLTMVIGRVGSGKSTFLSGLNYFVPRVEGEMKVSGSVAYVAQQAWILNSTVRENILFGKPYDEEKYQKTIAACQLEQDLDVLPNKDFTYIGERGVTLSGGQKQRVAIARAVYASADVYLMDDPLSAVDNHVGAALFEKGEIYNLRLVPVLPRSRCERRFLRTFAVVTLHPRFPFNV